VTDESAAALSFSTDTTPLPRRRQLLRSRRVNAPRRKASAPLMRWWMTAPDEKQKRPPLLCFPCNGAATQPPRTPRSRRVERLLRCRWRRRESNPRPQSRERWLLRA